jgi:hypothetical protein
MYPAPPVTNIFTERLSFLHQFRYPESITDGAELPALCAVRFSLFRARPLCNVLSRKIGAFIAPVLLQA